MATEEMDKMIQKAFDDGLIDSLDFNDTNPTREGEQLWALLNSAMAGKATRDKGFALLYLNLVTQTMSMVADAYKLEGPPTEPNQPTTKEFPVPDVFKQAFK